MSNGTCPACALTKPDTPNPARALGVCGTHYQQASRAGFTEKHPGKKPCPHCLAERREEIRPVKTRGRCQPHYRSALASGEIGPAYAPRGQEKACKAESGCAEPVRAKGYCNSHYGKLYRGVSDPNSPIRRAQYDAKCSFGGCPNPHHTGGLCGGHDKQFRAGKPLTPLRSYKARGGPCEAGSHECPHTAKHDGLCNRHYQRRLAGEPDWDRPIKPKAKNGDGHTDKYGYRIISHEGRPRREHVVFMEKLLNRPLHKGENVHHLNGDRADNRTDGRLRLVNGKLRSGNLEIWSASQPAGQEVGPKLDWAMEMLEEYAPYLTEEYRSRLARVMGVQA